MEKKTEMEYKRGAEKKHNEEVEKKKDNCIENEKKTDNTKRPLSTGLRGFLIPPPLSLSFSFRSIVQL